MNHQSRKIYSNPLFIKIRKMMILICGLFVCLYPVQAQDGCSSIQPSSPASFGTVTSFNMGKSERLASITNAGLRCKSPLISLLSADFIKATLTSTNGGYVTHETDTRDKVPYEIYAYSDYSGTYKVTIGQTYDYSKGNILNLLGLFGGNSITFPLYFRINPAVYNLSAGKYKDTLSVLWEWDFCLISITPLICASRNKGSTISTVNLELIITNDCMITAPDANFGSAPLVSEFNPITQTITITCTKGTTYSVGLDDGQNALSGQRRMVNGSNFINYDLFQGLTGMVRWGNNGGERRSSGNADIQPGAGTGNTSTPQGFIYQALISAGQVNKPAGTYMDTIIININF